MNIGNRLEKLQCTFPKLTEANQQYVLGLAEGLKQAQNGMQKNVFEKGFYGQKRSFIWQTGLQ